MQIPQHFVNHARAVLTHQKPEGTGTYMGAATTAKKRITDTKWFYDRLEAKGLSLRRAASILNIDHANLSLILRGVEGRYASLDLVCDLSRLFGVPVEDVMRRLGYDVPRESSARVHVIGEASGDEGRVEDMSKRAGGLADRPRGAPDDMTAIRIAAPGTWVDGALCYSLPASAIDPSAVGRLAIVRDVEERGYVGVLGKDRERGRWSVKPIAGGYGVSGLQVKSASPVEWIKL